MKRIIAIVLLIPCLSLAQWDGWNQGTVKRAPNIIQVPAGPDLGTPLAWYKMTDTGTNTTQILDFANTYHASNMPTVGTGPTLTTTNGAYYVFDGSADWFDSTLLPTNSKIAFTMWLNLNSISARYFFSFGNASDPSFRFWYNVADDTLRIRIAKSSKAEVEANLPANPSAPAMYQKWMHLAVVADGTTLFAYTNGALSATNVYDGTLYAGTTASSFAIGGYPGIGNYWLGAIDDVRVFTNLTAQQITNIYNAGRQ